jgi:hypothetical protein
VLSSRELLGFFGLFLVPNSQSYTNYQEMLAEPYQEKHALAAQFDHLNGEQLVVPSLKTIHPGWVLEKHPEYERLNRDLAAWCNRYFLSDFSLLLCCDLTSLCVLQLVGRFQNSIHARISRPRSLDCIIISKDSI